MFILIQKFIILIYIIEEMINPQILTVLISVCSWTPCTEPVCYQRTLLGFVRVHVFIAAAAVAWSVPAPGEGGHSATLQGAPEVWATFHSSDLETLKFIFTF